MAEDKQQVSKKPREGKSPAVKILSSSKTPSITAVTASIETPAASVDKRRDPPMRPVLDPQQQLLPAAFAKKKESSMNGSTGKKKVAPTTKAALTTAAAVSVSKSPTTVPVTAGNKSCDSSDDDFDYNVRMAEIAAGNCAKSRCSMAGSTLKPPVVTASGGAPATKGTPIVILKKKTKREQKEDLSCLTKPATIVSVENTASVGSSTPSIKSAARLRRHVTFADDMAAKESKPLAVVKEQKMTEDVRHLPLKEVERDGKQPKLGRPMTMAERKAPPTPPIRASSPVATMEIDNENTVDNEVGLGRQLADGDGGQLSRMKAACAANRHLKASIHESFVHTTLHQNEQQVLVRAIPSTRCVHEMSDPAQRLNSFLEMTNFPLESVPYYLNEIGESRLCRQGLLMSGHSSFSQLTSRPPGLPLVCASDYAAAGLFVVSTGPKVSEQSSIGISSAPKGSQQPTIPVVSSSPNRQSYYTTILREEDDKPFDPNCDRLTIMEKNSNKRRASSPVAVSQIGGGNNGKLKGLAAKRVCNSGSPPAGAADLQSHYDEYRISPASTPQKETAEEMDDDEDNTEDVENKSELSNPSSGGEDSLDGQKEEEDHDHQEEDERESGDDEEYVEEDIGSATPPGHPEDECFELA